MVENNDGSDHFFVSSDHEDQISTTTTFKTATIRKLKYYLVVSLGIHTIISGLATSSVVSDCSEENKRCELKTSIIRQSD